MNNLFKLLQVYNPSFPLDEAKDRLANINNVLQQDSFVNFIQKQIDVTYNIKRGGIETTIPPTYISVKIIIDGHTTEFKENIGENNRKDNSCIYWLQKCL